MFSKAICSIGVWKSKTGMYKKLKVEMHSMWSWWTPVGGKYNLKVSILIRINSILFCYLHSLQWYFRFISDEYDIVLLLNFTMIFSFNEWWIRYFFVMYKVCNDILVSWVVLSLFFVLYWHIFDWYFRFFIKIYDIVLRAKLGMIVMCLW